MKSFYIVTPVLNGAEFIDSAITHIVTQCGNFKLYYHIQDGGSTDGTIDKIHIWERLLSVKNPFVKCQSLHFSWASEKDNGIYDAVNKGFDSLDIPHDGIMGWCNADDIYLPYTLGCLSKVFSDIRDLKYLAGTWRFWEDSATYTFLPCRGPYPQEVMQNFCCDGRLWSPPPQPSIFWMGELWAQAGKLNPSLKYAADFELWRRFSLYAECAYFPLSLSACARHEKQLAKQRPSADGPSYYEIEKELLCPLAHRKKFMKYFWNRRILPPKGPVIVLNNGVYSIERQRGWPAIWNKSTFCGYLKRRLLYYRWLIKTKINNIKK